MSLCIDWIIHHFLNGIWRDGQAQVDQLESRKTLQQVFTDYIEVMADFNPNQAAHQEQIQECIQDLSITFELSETTQKAITSLYFQCQQYIEEKEISGPPAVKLKNLILDPIENAWNMEAVKLYHQILANPDHKQKTQNCVKWIQQFYSGILFYHRLQTNSQYLDMGQSCRFIYKAGSFYEMLLKRLDEQKIKTLLREADKNIGLCIKPTSGQLDEKLVKSSGKLPIQENALAGCSDKVEPDDPSRIREQKELFIELLLQCKWLYGTKAITNSTETAENLVSHLLTTQKVIDPRNDRLGY